MEELELSSPRPAAAEDVADEAEKRAGADVEFMGEEEREDPSFNPNQRNLSTAF